MLKKLGFSFLKLLLISLLMTKLRQLRHFADLLESTGAGGKKEQHVAS